MEVKVSCTMLGFCCGLQAGWKMLGDVLLQHADVTPLATPPDASSNATPHDGCAACIKDCTSGQVRRVHALMSARKAYDTCLQLNPNQAQVWGDLAMAVTQSAITLTTIAKNSALFSGVNDVPEHTETLQEPPAYLFALSQRIMNKALQLEPNNDALWALAGDLAASQAFTQDGNASITTHDNAPATSTTTKSIVTCLDSLGDDASPEPVNAQTGGTEALYARAEFCLSRSLQLNSLRGQAWASLSRLYAAHGEVQLAATTAERCRLVEPTLVSVWEAMAALSSGNIKVGS